MAPKRPRNETFSRFLTSAVSSIAALERKTTQRVEEELGHPFRLAGKTIQHYKAGYVPPEIEVVASLAEAGVRRGHLNRTWLEHFLRAARYPFADQLIKKLDQPELTRERPKRAYENLPAPSYSQFVMRSEAYRNVLEGIQQRTATVLIIGLAGNGKTSLAREVAGSLLKTADSLTRCDAVVWISDRDREGTTNLSVVLDEIARTLDYPGITQYPFEERRREVDQLLRNQRVLIVIDNLETVTDSTLQEWLVRLPEPSKAIVTSREPVPGLWASWYVELRGMSDEEAEVLIRQRLRMLGLERQADNLAPFTPLIAVTGGNPKALEMALGLLKRERRSIDHIVDDLRAARGDHFRDLFARAWALLDEGARRLLLGATFFSGSAGLSSLATVATVQGFALDHAAERLVDLGLLDIQRPESVASPRYTLHPLVRTFATARRSEHAAFEAEARERWISWHMELAANVGHSWNDLKRLDSLDSERDSLFEAFTWLRDHRRDAALLQMAKDIQYYYYIRGDWDRKQRIEEWRAEAARRLGDHQEELDALSYFIQMLARRGDIPAIDTPLARLNAVAVQVSLCDNRFFNYQHALGYTHLAHQQPKLARECWEICLHSPHRLSDTNMITCRQWIALCLHYEGRLEEARELFQRTRIEAEKLRYERAVLYSTFRLAAIYLDLNEWELARTALTESLALAHTYQDRRNIAEIQMLFARLYIVQHDNASAHARLLDAAELFERMGMRREYQNASTLMRQVLDGGNSPLAS